MAPMSVAPWKSALLAFILLTSVFLGGAHCRSNPASSIFIRAGSIRVAESGKRVLQDQPKSLNVDESLIGNPAAGGSNDITGSLTESAKEPKRSLDENAAEDSATEPESGPHVGGETSGESAQKEVDSLNSSHDDQDTLVGQKGNGGVDKKANEGALAKKDDVQGAESSEVGTKATENSPSRDMEIVGRGDEEKPNDVPPGVARSDSLPKGSKENVQAVSWSSQEDSSSGSTRTTPEVVAATRPARGKFQSRKFRKRKSWKAHRSAGGRQRAVAGKARGSSLDESEAELRPDATEAQSASHSFQAADSETELSSDGDSEPAQPQPQPNMLTKKGAEEIQNDSSHGTSSEDGGLAAEPRPSHSEPEGAVDNAGGAETEKAASIPAKGKFRKRKFRNRRQRIVTKGSEIESSTKGSTSDVESGDSADGGINSPTGSSGAVEREEPVVNAKGEKGVEDSEDAGSLPEKGRDGVQADGSSEADTDPSGKAASAGSFSGIDDPGSSSGKAADEAEEPSSVSLSGLKMKTTVEDAEVEASKAVEGSRGDASSVESANDDKESLGTRGALGNADKEDEDLSDGSQKRTDKGTEDTAELDEVPEAVIKPLKDLPETVKVSEKEDSANSGVPDEIALGNGNAAGTTVTLEGAGLGSDGAETPVATVGTQEQLELEQAALDDEEDYASFMSELLNAGQRLSPAMQGLQEKAAKHVVPKVQELALSGHAAFMKTSDQILHHVTPIVGPQFSPVVATILSFSLLLIPLVLVGLLVYQIRFILTLQRLLVLCNLYLCLYCFALLAACVIISGEPMRSLRQAAEPNFLILQIVVGFAYLVYLGLQVWWLVGVCRSKGRERDPIQIAKAVLQVLIALGIGLHYYVCVFERAMLDKPPKIAAWGYLVYSALFALLTAVARPKDSRLDVGKET